MFDITLNLEIRQRVATLPYYFQGQQTGPGTSANNWTTMHAIAQTFKGTYTQQNKFLDTYKNAKCPLHFDTKLEGIG